MRDLRHDNIVQFVGVTVEPGLVHIVTEYCTKGSLEVSLVVVRFFRVAWSNDRARKCSYNRLEFFFRYDNAART